MKLLNLLFGLSLLSLIFASCGTDCEQTVTYNKGIGIYGDLESMRVDIINSTPRTPDNVTKVYLSGDIMLMTEFEKGIHVYDNSTPEQPVAINFLDVPGVHEMMVEGDKLYVDAYYDLLEINISNPRVARLTQRLREAYEVRHRNDQGEPLLSFRRERVTETLDCSHNISHDEWVWVDFQGQRLTDSAVPLSFTGNGSTTGTVNRMALSRDHLYTIGHHEMSVFFIGGDLRRESAGSLNLGNGLETIYSFDDKLFVGARNNMFIFQLENPAAPQRAGSFWHATSCDPVLPVTSELAYVTLRSGAECPGDQNTVNLVNYSNLSNIVATQVVDMKAPYAMAQIDDQLFVGEGEHGFSIFEIGPDWRLTLVESNSDITAYDIIRHPTLEDVLLFAGPDGISQYQVSPGQSYNFLSNVKF